MDIPAKIESLLHFKNEPVKISWLASELGQSSEVIEGAVADLEQELSERGVVLMRKDDEVRLGTNPQMSEHIEKLIKEELNKDLGKAGLETLSIVIYSGPISRANIDYIRGVNSQFILRHLLVRGLVERVTNPADARSYLYRPTFDLLSFLGVNKIEDLPDYQSVTEQLKAIEEAAQSDEQEQSEDE